MKTQRALRLRQAGKHHLPHDHRGMYNGLARFGLAGNLARAFEMNATPKHSDEPPPDHPYTTMDYVTGITTWHGVSVRVMQPPNPVFAFQLRSETS